MLCTILTNKVCNVKFYDKNGFLFYSQILNKGINEIYFNNCFDFIIEANENNNNKIVKYIKNNNCCDLNINFIFNESLKLVNISLLDFYYNIPIKNANLEFKAL